MTPRPHGGPQPTRNQYAYRRKVTRKPDPTLCGIRPDVHRDSDKHRQAESTVDADRGRWLPRARPTRCRWLTLRARTPRARRRGDRRGGRRAEQLIIGQRRELLVDLRELLVP